MNFGFFQGDLDQLTPADTRLFGILVEYPEDHICVVQRPWVKARIEGGRPVEYRVFIQNNAITGISNYYTQRPIRFNKDEVADCTRKADAIIETCLSEGLVPWALKYAGHFNADKVSCTLDFLIEENSGGATFIEAGPPFGAGAHPCCFEHNVVNGQIECSGIALAP
jgi:hypothetical protein